MVTMDLEHVFVCGNPALDFAATLRARRSARFEMFASPDRLDAWYVEAGLVDTVGAGDADVERAKSVREAIYALVGTRVLGLVHDGAALDTLNTAARRPAAVPQLTAAGERRTDAAPDEALSVVARHAVELLSGPDLPLLKECANPECTRIFVDRSRGMRRQWCGMASCGNRFKAAAYRSRKASTDPT
jgi:predicted RNA-binding Zn ribbon-like protein